MIRREWAYLWVMVGILLGALAMTAGCAHVTLAHCDDMGNFIEVVNVRPNDYRTQHGYYLRMPTGWEPHPDRWYTCDMAGAGLAAPRAVFLRPWVKD